MVEARQGQVDISVESTRLWQRRWTPSKIFFASIETGGCSSRAGHPFLLVHHENL